MGKKRNQGRSGGGQGGSGGQGGGRTAETALMVRFRSWYRSHLAEVGMQHEHLEADEAVEVLTDLFAMTRDLRPRGSFAQPDAELLEAVFDQIEADLSGEESEADLDDTLFTVAEVVEHGLHEGAGEVEDLVEDGLALVQLLVGAGPEVLVGEEVEEVLDDLGDGEEGVVEVGLALLPRQVGLDLVEDGL
ncbi:hypothetical protein C5C27_12210, partial [Rathayibacter sp. AY2B7]|uniref:hypothetical protein n=1 Tax=Rathayibacter sp. AY2B7 TaxID=2080571 RepID=UPI000D4C1A88